jgi:hypothetical protein
MGYSVPRYVFTGRSLGFGAVSANSCAHIGRDMAPALVNPVNDIELTDFDEMLLYAKVTMSYTGGATDPTLSLTVQRKIAYDLPDTDDNAWEDFGAFDDISATGEAILRLGAVVAAINTETTVIGAHVPTRDSISAGAVRFGHPGSFLRVREVLSGGDRTGGSLSYNLRLLGIGVG